MYVGASQLAAVALRLETAMVGRFIDNNNGTTGSIKYGDRIFRRREIGREPHPRCNIDYGILVLRWEQTDAGKRLVIMIGGLGTVGTLGLSAILTNDRWRWELAQQAERLAPLDREQGKFRSIELCVRIDVPAHDLEDILNLLAAEPMRCPFDFRIEAVGVVLDDDTKHLWMRPQSLPELEIGIAPDFSGWVRLLPGGGQVELSAQRYALLKEVIAAGGSIASDTLLDRLYDGDGEKLGALHSLVHRTNRYLNETVFADSPIADVLDFDHRERRYVLRRVRGKIG